MTAISRTRKALTPNPTSTSRSVRTLPPLTTSVLTGIQFREAILTDENYCTTDRSHDDSEHDHRFYQLALRLDQ